MMKKPLCHAKIHYFMWRIILKDEARMAMVLMLYKYELTNIRSNDSHMHETIYDLRIP